MALTNCYCTLAQLKASIAIASADVADDTAIEAAITTASRMIDDYTNRFFYPDGDITTPVVRYFTAQDADLLYLDDFVSLTEVATDTASNRTYSTIWATTDFAFEPINNPRKSWPYTQLLTFNRYKFLVNQVQGVRVTGIWGWTAVPDVVRQACLIQASRLFFRASSPFGIAGDANLGTVRLSARLDPDVQVLLSSVALSEGTVS